MQQYRNNRNNGNIYDLRKDLQHTPPPSQQKGSSGSADGRYGFNGEPLSFAPDRTANGTVRRTRTDNSIEFPSQPRRRAACMGGLLSVLDGEVRLVATTWEWAEEIDQARAEASKKRAEEILAQKNLDQRDYELAQARLKRALVRTSIH